MNSKRNADPDILFPHDAHKRPPVAWIVHSEGSVPFMTLKPEVAEKRYKAGAHVVPYHSPFPPQDEEEEL